MNGVRVWLVLLTPSVWRRTCSSSSSSIRVVQVCVSALLCSPSSMCWNGKNYKQELFTGNKCHKSRSAVLCVRSTKLMCLRDNKDVFKSCKRKVPKGGNLWFLQAIAFLVLWLSVSQSFSHTQSLTLEQKPGQSSQIMQVIEALHEMCTIHASYASQ